MSIVVVLQQIGTITKAIHDQLKRYHSNPTKLKTLASSISKTVTRAQSLATRRNREQYAETLQELQEYLLRAQEFIQVFMDVLSNQTYWSMLVNFFSARAYDARIDAMKAELHDFHHALMLDISVQNQQNQEKMGEEIQQRLDHLEERDALKWSLAQKERSMVISLREHAIRPDPELTQKLDFLEGRTTSLRAISSLSSVTEEHMPAGKRAQRVGKKLVAIPNTAGSSSFSSDERASVSSASFARDLTESSRLASHFLGSEHRSRISSNTLKVNSNGTVSGTITFNSGDKTNTRFPVAESLTSIGLYKIEGRNGYRINKNEGIADLARAAEEGHEQYALYNLGVAYEKGYTDDGIPNLHLALEYYTKAAEAEPRDTMTKQKIVFMRRLIKAVSDEGSENDLGGQMTLSLSL